MPYRAVYLGLGVVGVVVVLLLVLFRADLRRHCAAGPRWKRRLVSAGLMLLGATGFGAELGCTKKDQPGPTPNKITIEQPKPKDDPVEKPQTPQPKTTWLERIEQTARAAWEVAGGKKGQFPFDRAGKNKMLASLDAAVSNIDELMAAGTLNAGEAGLWQADLKLLRSRVNGFRATEMKKATCYEPMPLMIPARQSMARLAKRLPLLEKMAAADKLHPRVARKVLAQIEQDLAVLSSDAELKKLPGDKDRKLARKQAAATRQVLDRVRGRLGIIAKGQDPRWAKVAQAWAALQAAIKSSSSVERKATDKKLEAAMAAVDELAREGKVTAVGAKLLAEEGKILTKEMYRNPHSDFKGKCYKRRVFIPARESLERINRRLPLLEKLVAAGKISAGVARRVLPALERDIQVLADREELQRMYDKAKRAEARKAHKRAAKVLARVRRLQK